MARPKIKQDEKREHCIMLRLTDLEYEMVSSSAEASGIPLAVYAREQVLKGKVNISYDVVIDIQAISDLTLEFGKIGNNLNQIAKYFHTGGIRSKAMQDEIHECITQLFDLREKVLKIAGGEHGDIKTSDQ